MNQFPHLKFVGKIEGQPVFRGGGQNEDHKKIKKIVKFMLPTY